jgi:undecaprenyl-diphosphatase
LSGHPGARLAPSIAVLLRIIRPLLTAARRLEVDTLALLVVASVGAWGFVNIADEVREGSTRTIDERLLLAMRSPSDVSDPIGGQWFEEIARDFTALGGTTILVLIVLAAATYLLLLKKSHAAVFIVVAVGGGQLLSTLFKMGFDRPRPNLVPHGAWVYTASFPSGHAMVSAVTYLTLGALLARLHKPRALKAFFLGMAVLLTILVGLSRVYLGVHWPTDVAAGWAAGSVWASVCWLVALAFQRRGKVEPAIRTQTPADAI